MDLNEFRIRILPLNSKLYHYAYLLLRDRNEAQDAVQEVFLKLWKIRESLEKYTCVEAFAMKVTRNWCLDRIKARKPVYIGNYQPWFENRSDDDPQQSLVNAENIKLLFTLIDKLPEQQRLIVQLRDLENMDFEEIAEIMDMNVNAIRVNLSRARNKMREEISKYESDGKESNSPVTGKIL
ncbi:MAG TPA: sigma-70 family RNA polymerase sigma factor [Bacteroidales bacterium]|jgi:RNA polymerase sigma-70 factor (ECF subfamily)|nr:sigma-70 family RNA polymerase sigma factor [Bacteroidales bacterium]